MNPSISLSELRGAFERVVNDIEARGIQEIEFVDGGYWYFHTEDALDIYGDPQPALGEYDDDIERLKKEKDELEVVSYNFIQSLSSVIQYIAARPPVSKT